MAIACKIDPLGIHNIPGGYKRVNYIKTADSQQWIDTDRDGKGIFLDGLSARYDVTLRTRILLIDSIYWPQALFAAKINNDTGAVLYCGGAQGKPGLYQGPMYTQENTGTVRGYNKPVTISDKPNTIVLSNVDQPTIDSLPGRRVATGGSYFANSSVSGAVCFFKNIRRRNETWETTSPPGVSLYECIIERDGIEVAHFVPCLDNTGRPCLFDIISRNTYYSSGKGELLWG